MCEVDVRFPVKTGAATKAVTELVKQMVSGNTGQIVEVTGSVSVAKGFGAFMNHVKSLLMKFGNGENGCENGVWHCSKDCALTKFAAYSRKRRDANPTSDNAVKIV